MSAAPDIERCGHCRYGRAGSLVPMCFEDADLQPCAVKREAGGACGPEAARFAERVVSDNWWPGSERADDE